MKLWYCWDSKYYPQTEELAGFNGSFVFNGGFPTTYGNANLNWRTEKLNIFLQLLITILNPWVAECSTVSISMAMHPVLLPMKTAIMTQRERFFINLGAEYYIDDKTSFTEWVPTSF